VPVAIALLAWDIFVWRESRPKMSQARRAMATGT